MKLELTRKTDLAVRALRTLQTENRRLTGKELAELIETTTPFVAQVIAPLVQAGWVDSRPGPTGGYTLSVDLRELSFLEVIESIEGPLDKDTCILAGGPCGQEEYCSLHEAWLAACEAMCGSFAKVPISDGI